MHSYRTLLAKVRALTPRRLAGPWCRGVQFQYLQGPPPGAPAGSAPQPLWPGASILGQGQRYTRAGGHPSLYLSESAQTSLMETDSVYRTGLNSRAAPLVVVTIQGSLSGILDVTEPANQVALGTSLMELTGSWRLALHAGGACPTQDLGHAAAAAGLVGLRYPSAKDVPSGINVVLFPANFGSSEWLEVYDPANRLAQKLP
jgi:RES domain-containing protein